MRFFGLPRRIENNLYRAMRDILELVIRTSRKQYFTKRGGPTEASVGKSAFQPWSQRLGPDPTYPFRGHVRKLQSRTGRLAQSMDWELYKVGGKFYGSVFVPSSVPYGRYHELGFKGVTAHRPPHHVHYGGRPFLYPAIIRSMRTIRAMISSAMERSM